MKIIVSHVYSNDNKGDAALLSVLLADIRRAFVGAQVTILTMDNVKKGETFEGVPMKNGFMYYASTRYKNSLAKIGYGIFLATSTLAWAAVYRITKKNIPIPKNLREIATIYKETDFIIAAGGGYLRGQKGFMSDATLFFIIHPFLFSALLGKPTVNYTQSV